MSRSDIFPFSDSLTDLSAGNLSADLQWKRRFRRTPENIAAAGVGDSFTYELISDQIRATLMRTIEPTIPVVNKDYLFFSEDANLWTGYGARLSFSECADNRVMLASANSNVLEDDWMRGIVTGSGYRSVMERILSNSERLIAIPGIEDSDKSVLSDLIVKIRAAFESEGGFILDTFVLGT
jgi:hypothetical protein